jgi:lipid-A-disaccharide synthase
VSLGPRTAVALECARALGSLALLPARAALHAAAGAVRTREVAALLGRDAPLVEAPEARLPDRPLRVFVSAAEPSGETHALGLVRALHAELERRGAPPPELAGLGGPRLAALGVRTLGDPVARAAMGSAAAGALSFHLALLARTAAHVRAWRPDVVVPVDSPALHVPLARIVRRYGPRVVHFVTPQHWGWAPWRVRAYRRAVDLGLAILPFETEWFARRGARVAHVGHPHLDALRDEPADRAAETSRVLVLLPGSRERVIERNLPWMLVAAGRLRLEIPDLEVVVPHQRSEVRPWLERHVSAAGAERWVAVESGRLHRWLGRARAALSVSGTVGIDLLHHRLPGVVVYRLGGPLAARLAPRVLTVPWFSSVNLLAGREVLPEFCFWGEGPLEEVCSALARCYKDAEWRARCVRGLEEAAGRLGPPGACERAARWVLAAAGAAGDAGAEPPWPTIRTRTP